MLVIWDKLSGRWTTSRGKAIVAGPDLKHGYSRVLCTILTPWANAEEVFEYVLVQCGTPVPDGFETAQMVTVPVETIVTMSTTFLPHLDAQGMTDRIVGMDSDSLAMTAMTSIQARNAAGEITNVGVSWQPDIETLIDLDAAVIMVQQFAPEGGVYDALRDMELPAVLNSDFVDTTPLGRAEWGKYIALFFNTEAIANDVFDGVAERYTELAALTAAVTERPTVFTGVLWASGTWYMPGGQSYVAALLQDAGANYLWSEDTSTDTLYLDLETVLEVAGDADFWVNAGVHWTTLADGLAEDERNAEFAAFQNGNVYTYNLRVTEGGGLEYFETGAANPDVVLADLIAIFHPDLLPEHEFIYYQQIPAGE